MKFLGEAVLREKAQPVEVVTDELRTLIDDMFDTMYAEDGVGLAAPQVGVSQRVVVIDPRDDSVAPFALINPEIRELSEEVERGEEGCLSLPGLKEMVERPVRCLVEATSRDGTPLHLLADGLLARIIQHEVDHLDGILFIDRLSPLKRKMLLRRWQKVKPEDAPA